MAMTSFYGGPKGQDFEISYVFRDKEELIKDLEQGWVSPIALGSYVMISYSSEDINYTEDRAKYNSTLWRKIYIEQKPEQENPELYHEVIFDNVSHGIAYGLIATLTGATPKITVENNKVKANEDPSVAIDYAKGLENPVITFNLPEAWDISVKNSENPLNANENPTVNVEYDPNGEDSVKTFVFSLPRSQVLGLKNTNVANPEVLPSVVLDPTEINNPKLQFTLPRAVQFYYGNGTDNIKIDEAKQGDYYIDRNTAHIYFINGNDANGLKLELIANLSGEKPEIGINPIAPYDENGVPTSPSVKSSFENEDLRTGYSLEFSLPQAPEINANFEELGAAEESSLTTTKSTAGIALAFKMSRGARWFISATTSINVSGAKAGDYCLIGGTSEVDVNRGDIYQFDGVSWQDTGSNILGRTGSGVKVLEKLTITSGQVADPTETALENYINEHLNVKPNVDEVLPVDYSDSDGNTTSYWYYYINDKWYRQTLTGGTAGLINDQYDKDNSTSTGYSVRYLNEQFGLKADQTAVDDLSDTVAGKASSDSVVAIQTKIGTIESDISSLKSKDNELNTAIEQVKTTATNNKTDITTINNKLSSYLTRSDASSTYLTINDAGSTYLTKSDATKNYYTKDYIEQNFLASSNKYEPVITTLSIEKGGTGANNLDGVQQNLGITDIKSNIQTINSNINTINSNINTINNNVSLKPKTGTETWSSEISLEVGQMYLQHE